MKNICQALLVLAWTAIGGASYAQEGSRSEVDLAKATIIIGAKAEAPEIFAAEELSKYLEKMSGIKLPIAKDSDPVTKGNFIFIGTLKSNGKIQGIVKKGAINADKLDKNQDGFIIKTFANNLVLLGSNPRSALYSVYAFLERLGYLWPAPGEDFVTNSKHICIQDVDVSENADLNLRMAFCGFGGFHSVAWVDWLGKNRINWICFMSGSAPGYDDWKKTNIIPELEKRGIKVDFGSDGAVTYFLPPGKYYQEHPEYYALVNGKRKTNQVCVSNPDVIRLEAENIVKFLKKNPEIGMIWLSPGDNFNYCECEKCMELDKPLVKGGRWNTFIRSNSYIIFENEVLNRVNIVFPDVKFTAEHYNSWMEPPRVSLVKLNKNLFSIFNFYVRCASHAIGDRDCKVNCGFYSAIEGWAKCYDDKKRIIPFDLNVGMDRHLLMPLPMLNTMAKDFPYYKEFGGIIIWYFGGSGYEQKNYYNLNDYVAMRLAWNVNESLDNILSAYFSKYYGKAGNIMHDYFMGWEDVAQRLNNSGKHYLQVWRKMTEYVNEEDIKKFEDMITKANSIPESNEIKKRIKDAEDQFNLTKLIWQAGMKLDAAQRCEKAGNIDQEGKEKEEALKIAVKLSESEIGMKASQYIVAALRPSIKESSAGTNLVFNNGFEYGLLQWRDKGGASKGGAIDTNEFHGVRQCIRFANSSLEEVFEIRQDLSFNQKEPRPIRIGGWNKAKEVMKGKGRYGIYVNFYYDDGTQSGVQVVQFDPGTHDWQYGEKIFNPEKPVKWAIVHVFFENHVGTAWFDDICVAQLYGLKETK